MIDFPILLSKVGILPWLCTSKCSVSISSSHFFPLVFVTTDTYSSEKDGRSNQHPDSRHQTGSSGTTKKQKKKGKKTCSRKKVPPTYQNTTVNNSNRRSNTHTPEIQWRIWGTWSHLRHLQRRTHTKEDSDITEHPQPDSRIHRGPGHRSHRCSSHLVHNQKTPKTGTTTTTRNPAHTLPHQRQLISWPLPHGIQGHPNPTTTLPSALSLGPEQYHGLPLSVRPAPSRITRRWQNPPPPLPRPC